MTGAIDVYIGIGTNLGDKLSNIKQAISLIGKEIGQVISKSKIYESKPWGFESDQLFYNAAVLVTTEQTLEEVLKSCLRIEKSLGRTRGDTEEGYASRLIDLDILLCEQYEIEKDELIVPHPLNLKRLFVVQPILDILRSTSSYKSTYDSVIEGVSRDYLLCEVSTEMNRRAELQGEVKKKQ